MQSILIDDDVAVKDSLYTAGRRGVGTTVLAEKVVGAAAEAGYDLDQCADLCRKVNQYGRSMGMALTSCIVPAAGKPTFDLRKTKLKSASASMVNQARNAMKMDSADEITEMMALEILEDEAYTRTVREWDSEDGDMGRH